MASAYFMLRILRRKKRKGDFRNELPATKEKIKIADDVKQCRICLREGNIPIYGNGSLAECSEYIRQLGGIEISDTDKFPKYLCTTCQTHLHNAILFRKTAKESDLILRQNFRSQLNHDTSELDFKEETFPGVTALYSDEEHKAELKSYKCQPCNMNFVNCAEYMVHKNSKQHKNIRIQCPICFGLLTSQLFKKHLARHQSSSQLICDICGKLYRKDNLIRHLQLHSYNLPHQCKMCPYRGRFSESLKIHMRTHTGDKPFTCVVCQLRFLTRSNLNRHLMTHNKERPFKCSECSRGFYAKRDLDVHYKADHAGIKDFGCKMCGNKYSTRKALMRHELRVHKRDKLAKGRMPLYLQSDYKK